MKYIKYYEELNNELKKEVDIIYRDSNLVCLMPKSQKTSCMYGRGTEWCQTNYTGFNLHSGNFNPFNNTYNSEINFIIRFFFKKEKRKIRFTYYPNKDTFYWAKEQKHHLMITKGDDFFNPKPLNINNIRDLEKEVLNLIKEIPQECRDKVKEYINTHKGKHPKDFYTYRKTEYTQKEVLKNKNKK